jgi:protein TonB
MVAFLIFSSAIFGMTRRFQAQSDQQQYDRSVRAPQRVKVSNIVAQKLLVKKVNPEWSKDLRKKRIQGMVTLGVEISKNGDVTEVKLISGHPALAQAAMDAVRQWKFKPYLLNGEAVEVETQISINFTLAGG